MATYINTKTLEYPLFIGDIQLLFSNATEENFPEQYKVVNEATMPEVAEGETVEELSPTFADSVWNQVLSVRKLTAQELQNLATHREEIKIQKDEEKGLNIPGSAPNVIG